MLQVIGGESKEDQKNLSNHLWCDSLPCADPQVPNSLSLASESITNPRVTQPNYTTLKTERPHDLYPTATLVSLADLCCFSPIFCFSYSAASGTASPISQDLSYSSSSAIPVMVNHVCTSELPADLGRSFSKRKTCGGNFHSWDSHLTSSQHSNPAPASPYVDSAGRDGFVLLCQTCCFQRPLAVSGGGHSWTQSSLLLRFLQGELHTASILTITGVLL